MIYDHQRWLATNGRFGKRLEVRDGLQLKDCDCEGVDFSGAILDGGVQFKGGSVRGACFVGTSLSEATFDSCDVGDADFTRANLSWATFATNHKDARFEGSDFANTAWSAEEGERMFARRLERDSTMLHSLFRVIGPNPG